MGDSMNESERNEEDRIIESIIVDGAHRLFDDADFLPIRQSLYNIENVIPMYDDEVSPQITWCRPQILSQNPVYFESSARIGVSLGTLPDDVFIGALLAVCAYPKFDLMENIFSSKPDDFKEYGVFTCRFYVEGDWVEVITDTNIPCVHDTTSNVYSPVYSRSFNPDEMWIPLAEKAYAKAVGSYEAIPRVRIQETLTHLTGGSIQQSFIQDDSSIPDAKSLWPVIKNHIDGNTLILATPINTVNDDVKEDLSSQMESLNFIDTDKADNSFVPSRVYSIISYREIGEHHLLLVHNPWSKDECWHGNWSNKSPLWYSYSSALQNATNNLEVSWSPESPNGYFWISCQDFFSHFNNVYYCKLFPSEKYKFYCVRDEWKEKQAGGPLTTVRDKTLALKDALESKKNAANKASVVCVIDGDASWFNNPQVRIHSSKPCSLYVSCMPLTTDKDGNGLAVGLDIVATKRIIGGMSADQYYIWDSVTSDIIGSDRIDGAGRTKGQEASAWGISIDPNHNYHIIAHTMKRGQEGSYLLRIFATEPLVVEQIPSVYYTSLQCDWHRTHDMDSTGGPLKISGETQSRENSKWCQNPQFYLELKDLFSKDDLKMKIVVRRTDKVNASHHRGIGGVSGNDKAVESYVGLVVCRADCLQENVLKNKLKKQPRMSAVGELIPSKTSTLKKKPSNQTDSEIVEFSHVNSRKDTFDITMVPRKYSVLDEPHVFETTYTSRSEAVIYLSKIPRSLLPQGMIIVPSLHDKGIKGSFELEVYSSEPVILKQLPDAYNKSLASEWSENTAMGSHINPNWKKNPRFLFHFRHSTRSLTSTSQIPVRITLGRHGQSWAAMTKKDPVGCMIGFYVFVLRNGELEEQVYESVFAPNDELSTDPGFTLTPLPVGEEYVIIPATCAEGKVGSFIITIMTEAEFKLSKDKA